MTVLQNWTQCGQDQASTFEVSAGRMFITFDPCGVVSYHHEDVEQRYCHYFNRFIEDRKS